MNSPVTTPQYTGFLGTLDRFFQITQRGSSVSRELRGGLVTFFAMSYILVLNPIILSGMDSSGGFLGRGTEANIPAIAAGTALVAGVLSLIMGLWANYPLALASGMGLNAMVAFTLVGASGLTWAEAMGLIVWEGIIILVLVLTGFREAVFRAVPAQMKTAISVGIGLFIALVGLVNAGIVRPGGTPLQLGINGSLAGWPALVFVVGLLVTIVLMVRKVRGAILIGILSATVVGIIIQLFTHLGAKSEENPTGWGLTIPELKGSPVSLPDFSTLGQFDLFGSFGKIGFLAVLLLVFSLMLADFFDTMGTMVAIGGEAGLLDEEGNPPRTRQILVVDSIGAAAGGMGGVSSATSYVESSAGVGEGARTGLATVVTGLLFMLSMFLAPIVELVPSEAASTALVAVGFLMMTQVTEIEWHRPEIAIPSFLTIALMPFAYSITVGIGAGFVTYLIIELALGRVKKIHPLMWIVSLLFVLYFVLGPLQSLLGV
ncbi:permease [Bowdeniella nasicola]|uniref:Permease n=1 Tax=Bowdeniella nasicola TaxID=208480 RepID=A0A1Q5Q4K1_9ACTO|nr:NCS2 family permease [Bowdeniella nasicola]OKL54747.1 permease [Bowdeniella nasicola]